MYTLKITYKGGKAVGKVDTWIHVEKYNRLKIKIIKIEKKKKEEVKEKRRRRRRKGKLPKNAKAQCKEEVYNNNKKCDWIYTYTYTPISKIKTV